MAFSLTFFPNSTASFSLNVLSLVNFLNFSNIKTLLAIASLATALQFISGKPSIFFFKSSGTDKVILTIFPPHIHHVEYVSYVKIFKSLHDLHALWCVLVLKELMETFQSIMGPGGQK